MLRHIFFLRTQNTREDVDNYITALRRLVAECQFENVADQLVRDQFICHCTDKTIKQKLLSMGNPTLDETIRVAKSIETSQLSAKELDSKNNESVSAVKVKDAKDKDNKSSDRSRQNFWKKQNAFFSKSNICFSCGYKAHNRGTRCPAKFVTCKNCNKTGHFAKVCQAGRGRTLSHPSPVKCVVDGGMLGDNEESVTKDLSDMVLVVHDDGVIVGNLEMCADPYVEISVGDRVLKLLVDSGARISMITLDLYTATWPNRPLLPPDRKAVSYEGREINLSGYIEEVMEFRGRRIAGKLYVAHKGLNILGWFHQGLFGMVLRPGTKAQVLAIRDDPDLEDLVNKFPYVFSGELGKIRDFQHKIIGKNDARPVKQKLRNVPFSVRQDLGKELDSLCAKSIIEPVESSL